MDHDARLEDFSKDIREKMEETVFSKNKYSKKREREMILYIAERTGEMVKLGVSEEKIHSALDAAGDAVRRTAREEGLSGFEDDPDESPDAGIVCVLPMHEDTVKAFSSGDIGDEGLMNAIDEKMPDLAIVDLAEGLELVLTGFGKDMSMDGVVYGGEIVAGSDGEAVIPECLEVTAPDGESFEICEPMVFKTNSEIRAILARLEPIDEKTFSKKASINKLVRSGWLDNIVSAKKDSEWIKKMLWYDLETLRKAYRKAAEDGNGTVTFITYI